MSNTENLVFMGLPGSGKTTFLAALWHVLEDGGSETSLKLRALSIDRTYLNQITADWQSCTQVQRTKLDQEEEVALSLTSATDVDFDLKIPDLSGEAFDQQVSARRMSAVYRESLETAIGLVLFVHSKMEGSRRLTIINRAQSEIADGAIRTEVETTKSELIHQTPWSTDHIPAQVRLVELLQFAASSISKGTRIAIVISAWDLIDSLGYPAAPGDYIAREMPLLSQFLESNSDRHPYTVFGVSAQGGDITVQAQKEELLNRHDASDRVKVLHGTSVSNDISRPIAWLVDQA